MTKFSNALILAHETACKHRTLKLAIAGLNPQQAKNLSGSTGTVEAIAFK
ncbi:MAG: hypothetical protein HXY43_12765 [Fischerella sp.]|jgi:hypothetical protein|nr:hypothetical protein [Fischerella sp.]NWF60110.1 hypothetical protein [Fischerella sp.]